MTAKNAEKSTLHSSLCTEHFAVPLESSPNSCKQQACSACRAVWTVRIRCSRLKPIISQKWHKYGVPPSERNSRSCATSAMPEPLQLVDNEEVEAVTALRAMLFPAPKVFPRRTTGTAASTCLCRLCQRRAGRALKGPAGPLLEPRSPLKAEARPRVSLRASAPAGEVSGHVLSQMQPAGLQTTCNMHQGLSQSRGSWLMVREVQGVEASCSLLQACGLRPMVGKV